MLFFRELGFGLKQIKVVLESPDYRRGDVLRQQRELLQERRERVDQLIAAVDAALKMEEGTMNLTSEEMLEVFGDFDLTAYNDEVQQRWGSTEPYGESARRTAKYTKADWQAIGEESGEINAAFIALMQTGAPADSAEAMAVAERHREHISRWFYDCSPEVHSGLGQLYITEDRFAQNIDKAAPGLAAYMAQAFGANAKRAG